METTMTVTEAARNFSDLINRIAYRGDTAVLTRNGTVVARIVPEKPKAVTGKTLAALWESLPHLSPEEAEEWERDISAGRAELNRPEVPRNPWENRD